DAVPHLARRRARVPAIRAAPRHRGSDHGREERAMTATSVAIRAVGGNRPARRPREKWGNPWVYLLAVILVSICITPVLYIIIGGFRTNAQITQDPSGWPEP